MTYSKQATQAALALCSAALVVLPVVAQVKGDPTRGKKAFKKAACEGCHPGGGNTITPQRPLKGAGFLKRFPDDRSLEAFIRKGNPDKGMPGFGPQDLSENDLKDVMAYIRSLTPRTGK
jgi:mono/diheme cytochrome c family protein